MVHCRNLCAPQRAFVLELVKRLLLLRALAPSSALLDKVRQDGAGIGEILYVAAVEVARPNEAAYIMESFLGVFMSHLSIHQGFGLRGRRGPPPLANVEPQVLHGFYEKGHAALEGSPGAPI